MTTFTMTRTATTPATGTVSVFAGMVIALIRGGLRILKNRHDAALLTNFDDRMLADIGLSRSDLRDAYSVPFWHDPTALLRTRAGERQRYRRGAPFGLGGQAISAPPLVPERGPLPRPGPSARRPPAGAVFS